MIRKNDIEEIARNATMIVKGYAFSYTDGDLIRVIDTRRPHHAAVMKGDGEVIETNMNAVELDIIAIIWRRNGKYMEDKRYAEVL